VQTAVLTSASLIETHYPGGRVALGARRALDERLDRLGVVLNDVVDIPHDEAAISSAIKQKTGDVVCLFTAGPLSDGALRRGVEGAEGQVIQQGIPVDPGGDCLIATCMGRSVVGLPNIARRLTPNGADDVLDRIICGVSIDAVSCAELSIGGLFVSR